MKKLVLSVMLLSFYGYSHAQLGHLKNKINQKMNEKIDQGVDEAVDGPKKEQKTKTEKETAQPAAAETGEVTATATTQKAAAPAFKSYSKFDFLPGEKVIAFDDFSTDNIGDFPAKWNTNGSGEVVNISSAPGKWFAMSQSAYYRPDYITSLPENFTIEFDLAIADEQNSGAFIVQLGRARAANDLNPTSSGLEIHFISSGDNYMTISNWCYSDAECSKITILSNTNDYHFNDAGEKFRVSLWRQKQRLRVYVNETKVFDAPRILDGSQTLNCLDFRTNANKTGNYAFVSNLRVAAGAPDTRNKLMTEGKFVTSGITFDVNSDKIKPESYGVLKEIATVLTENAGVKVKIVGHTDSDGDDAKNLELSNKRAVAVKNTLSKEFAIDAARLTTDGKGETQPLTPNTTAEAKANNRRVEFLKQ